MKEAEGLALAIGEHDEEKRGSLQLDPKTPVPARLANLVRQASQMTITVMRLR